MTNDKRIPQLFHSRSDTVGVVSVVDSSIPKIGDKYSIANILRYENSDESYNKLSIYICRSS